MDAQAGVGVARAETGSRSKRATREAKPSEKARIIGQSETEEAEYEADDHPPSGGEAITKRATRAKGARTTTVFDV